MELQNREYDAPRTGFAASRRIIGLIGEDPILRQAEKVLGIYPQVTYKKINEHGYERVRRVWCYFIGMVKENPAFFYVDTKGENYDKSHNTVQMRARLSAMSVIKRSRPLAANLAPQLYREEYPR